MKQTVAIRSYQPGDEAELNSLFNLVFGENRSLEEWQWKYNSSICVSDKFIVIAQVQEQIIGMYPAVITQYKVGDKLLPTPLVVDAAIHPEWRQWRTFLALRKQMGQNFKDMGIVFAFGFPTLPHYKLGKKLLKYKDLLAIPILFKRLNWRLAFRQRFVGLGLEKPIRSLSHHGYKLYHQLRRPRPMKIRINRITHFDKHFDRLWDEVAPNYGIIAVRNGQYLNWRYQQPTVPKYTVFAAWDEHNQLRGYMVLALENNKAEKIGLIVDFLTTSQIEVTDALLYQALAHFLAQRADYVKCLALAHYPQYPVLLSYGFSPRYQPIRLVYETYNTSRLNPQYLENPQNWFLTYGDTDWH